MAKSIRSKIKKRLRTAKRQRVDAMLVTPRNKDHYEKLQQIIQGRGIMRATPKNAFKYPDAEDAVFPQHEVIKPIDFRAQNLPMAGYVFRGNRRKYEGEQAEYMTNLAKNSHPEMEVLAGGGAVLAKTGQRVSVREAELIATAVQRPQDASLAMPASTSAVAEAVNEEVASSVVPVAMDTEMAEVEVPSAAEPQDEADHTRRPIPKDTRRAGRTAAHKPRANATKKSQKVVVQAEAPAPKEVNSEVQMKTDSPDIRKTKKHGLKKKA